ENQLLPTELRREALALQKELEFDFDTPGGATSSQDDEYRWAGVEPPKVMVTTSRDPSSRLRLFAKVGGAGVGVVRVWVGVAWGSGRGWVGCAPLGAALRLSQCLHVGGGACFGGCGHLWAGSACGRGSLSTGWPGGVPVTPSLSPQVGTILKHLFPVPRPDSRRVVTFANEDDVILVRNHVYRRRGRTVELEEVGPRFQLRPYLIRLGTLEQGDAADVEWRWHPYTATAPKRRLLSAT
ncbi:IMP4 protein, partial [Oxyruncus cristatus]|nr:IMP4 protein [Oxyruncus cristatus]